MMHLSTTYEVNPSIVLGGVWGQTEDLNVLLYINLSKKMQLNREATFHTFEWKTLLQNRGCIYTTRYVVCTQRFKEKDVATMLIKATTCMQLETTCMQYCLKH